MGRHIQESPLWRLPPWHDAKERKLPRASERLADKERHLFVLEEQGENISDADLGDNPVFVLGDHVGLPRKDEKFALRYGKKISLGKKPYLAATCVDVINYFLDRRAKGK